MGRLRVESVGQIREADVTPGDLTVLVGPQATGKSSFLQFLKLALDGTAVSRTIKKYGCDWKGQFTSFLSLYFGEGMEGLWNGGSLISWDGSRLDFDRLLRRGGKTPPFEGVLYPCAAGARPQERLGSPFHGLRRRRSVLPPQFQRAHSAVDGSGPRGRKGRRGGLGRTERLLGTCGRCGREGRQRRTMASSTGSRDGRPRSPWANCRSDSIWLTPVESGSRRRTLDCLNSRPMAFGHVVRSASDE